MNTRNGGLSGSPVAGKKFLNSLQNFIKNELLVSQGKFKIGIYRQAFDYFIQEFKTYSSVLSDIKNEYELTISELEESKRQLEPLKGKLEILKLQNLQELNAQTSEMDDFLEKFRWENQNLREQSLGFEEKIQVQKLEISNLLKENTLLKEKIKDSGCKITDNRSKQVGNKELQEKDAEIERLQGLVVKANRKIADLSKDLQGLTENNDDFITPDKFHEEKKKVEEFQKKYSTCLGEIAILEKKIQDLTLENEEYKKESDLLESFKFPDWQYIQYQVPYSVREYEVGCKRMGCNDVIGQILAEILKIKAEHKIVKTSNSELDSKGLSKTSVDKMSLASLDGYWNDVKALGIELPKFLKFKGRLKNRNMSKVQTIEFVIDVFEAKKRYDSLPKNKGKETELLEFFSLYLKKRFGSKGMLVEVGVNILYYSNNFGASTALLNTFYKIIIGIWDISIYNHLDSVISKVKSLYSEADIAFHNGVARGSIEPSKFLAYLKSTVWSKKSKINLQSLEEVLDETNPESLFSADSEFVNVICQQELEASRLNYLTLTSSIKGESIPYHAILDLLSKTYNNKSIEEIQRLLTIAYGKEKIKDSELIMKADLLKTLNRYV